MPVSTEQRVMRVQERPPELLVGDALGIDQFSTNSLNRVVKARREVVLDPNQEKKSFNQLSYINMMRFDLQHFGRVLPETREQVGNEFLSQICEAVDRSSKTTFILRKDQDGLKYFKDGKWTPYSTMIETGLEVADNEAKKDPRKSFLVGWAERDKLMAERMAALEDGKQLTWDSPFPKEIERKYGRDFMQGCGLQPAREMGFLYRAQSMGDYIKLESQTVDRSHPRAFTAARIAAELDPHISIEKQVKIYDITLGDEIGGTYRAGRQGAERRDNAWDEILKNKDLINYALQEFEHIAASSLQGRALQETVERHVYGTWALFSKRLKGESKAYISSVGNGVIAEAERIAMKAEIGFAFKEFAQAGKVMVACGGDLKMSGGEAEVLGAGSKAMLEAKFKEIFAEIYGDIAEDDYDFDIEMFCLECQAPPSQYEIDHELMKMCGPCGFCKDCDQEMRSVELRQSDFALAS